MCASGSFTFAEREKRALWAFLQSSFFLNDLQQSKGCLEWQQVEIACEWTTCILLDACGLWFLAEKCLQLPALSQSCSMCVLVTFLEMSHHTMGACGNFTIPLWVVWHLAFQPCHLWMMRHMLCPLSKAGNRSLRFSHSSSVLFHRVKLNVVNLTDYFSV